MTKVTNRLLSLVLSFAMILTGFTFLGGAASVNAEAGDKPDIIVQIDSANEQPATGGSYSWAFFGEDDGVTLSDFSNDDFTMQVKVGDGEWTDSDVAAVLAESEEYTGLVTAAVPDNTDPVSKQWRFTYAGNIVDWSYSTVDCPAITQAAAESTPDPVAITVTFDAQGGTVDPASVEAGEDGKLASLPTPQKEGFDFLGWFDAAEGGNEVTADKVYEENTTIFAHWKEAVDVDAPYDANDFTYGEYVLGTDSSVAGVNSVYPGNDQSYLLPGTKWVVTGFSESGAAKFKAGHTDLVIPAKDPEGRTVEGVGDYAFQAGATNKNPVIAESGKKVTGVTFPEGAMTTENIADVNTKWADYLGKHGPLTEMGSFVIGYYAFASNDIEGELVIPEGTILITNSAFQTNKKITKVTFPSTIININKMAFAACTNLKEVVFPAETDIRLSIRQQAFFTDGMTAVELPKDTLQVQGGTASAFRNNTGTNTPTEITIKGKESSFVEASNYQKVTYQPVSEEVAAVEPTCEEAGHAAGFKCLACGKVFSDADMTQEVADGVTPALGHDWEFKEITKQPTADEDGEATFVCKNDPSHTKTETIKFAWEASDFTYNEAGDTVTGLSASGYQKLDWNPDMALPGKSDTGVTVTAVGDGAFQSSTSGKADCAKITNVTFPESITSIGKLSFAMCSIKDLVLPDNITTVGMAAFQSNAGMRSVKLSENMTEIPQGMFSTNAVSMDASEGIHVVVIPEKVTKIGASAFQGQHVSELTLPAGLTEIGNSAFKNHQLTELEIPEGVKTLGPDVFTFTQEGPQKTLAKVTLHEGLTSIGRRAFGGSKLAELEIPDSVTSIHNDAFKAQLIPADQTTVCLIKSSSPLAGSADGSCHTFKVLYKVTFKNSESEDEDVVAWTDKDGKIAELPYAKSADPGKLFAGWFKADAPTEEVTADTVFTADTEVTAAWRDMTPAEVVEAAANALPDEVTAADKEAIEDVRAKYDALSDEEKASLPEDVELKIKAAEAKLAEIEAKAEAEQAKTDAEEAQAKAEEAATAAAAATPGTQDAVDKANAAKAAADEALAKAEAAKAAAEKAYGADSDEAKAAEKAVTDAKDAVTKAETAKAAAEKAKADADKAAADKAAADKAAAAKAAEEKAKSVKTVTVNVKTVNAAAIDKAVAAAGGSPKYVTKIVLGKKVKTIKAKAFKKYTKVKTLEVRTKKLTKKSVKKSLKSSKVKTIKVKVAKKAATNKKYVKKYKKFFTKKNAGKKVTVKR